MLDVYVSYLRASIFLFLVLSIVRGLLVAMVDIPRMVELSEEGITSFATKLPFDGILIELSVLYCHRPFYSDIRIILPPS